jgi:twinkle protein
MYKNPIRYITEVHPEWKYREQNGIIYVKSCPFCHGTGKNNEETFRIKVDTGVWKCWRGQCNRSGNLYQLQKELDGIAYVPGIHSFQSTIPARPKKYFSEKSTLQYHADLKNNPEAMSYLISRCISDKGIDHFKLGLKEDWIMIPSFDMNGNVVSIKMRGLKEKKFLTKQHEGHSILFNEKALKDNDTVIIVEGEFDAVALWESGYTNVVSLPHGCQTIKPEWILQLQRKLKVILLLDADEGGQKGAYQIAKRVGYDKCFNIDLSDYYEYKDINELLINNYNQRHKIIKELIANAKPVDISGIVSAAKVFKRLRRTGTTQAPPEVDTPFAELNKYFGGLYPGRLVVVSAPAKIGKTSLCLQIGMHNLLKCKAILIYELEMSFRDLMIKLLQIYGHKEKSEITNEYFDRIQNHVFKWPLYFGSWKRGMTFDRFHATVSEAVRLYDIKLLIFDHLHFMLRYAGRRSDEISELSKNFKLLAEELEIPVLLIAEPRKVNTDRMMTMEDIRDSAAVAQDADDIICLHRERVGSKVN